MFNLVIKVQFGRRSFSKLPQRHEFFSHQMGSASRDFGFWVVAGATEFVKNFRCVAEPGQVKVSLLLKCGRNQHKIRVFDTEEVIY